MPPAPPVAHATVSQALPSKPYILGITSASPSPHLILRHPAPELSLVDAQSLQVVDVLKDGHAGNVTDVCVDQGSVWSGAKDSTIVRWDERSRRSGQVIKAFVRKPLPVTALAVSETDYLVIAGTELVSAEAHIIYWDMRNAKEPIYVHSSTHSDDITHLSLLPSTSTFLPSSSSKSLPPRLLLSASTDGLVALSNVKESDEDEAVVAEENWGQSIAAAGSYVKGQKGKEKMGIWARSDMDGVAVWSVGKGEDEEIELQDQIEYDTDKFKFRKFVPPLDGPSVPRTAAEERTDKSSNLTSDYLIDVVPSWGTSKHGVPMSAVGTNEGDIVILHEASSSFQPSAYFLSGPSSRGHKDVVRCLYHDRDNEAIYTGSEDGVISGWSLASLPAGLRTGDPEVDDDGGDGREMENDDQSEESEIETEESDDSDGMDVDDSDESEDPGPRSGPVLGGGSDRNGRTDKRKDRRAHPYS